MNKDKWKTYKGRGSWDFSLSKANAGYDVGSHVADARDPVWGYNF